MKYSAPIIEIELLTAEDIVMISGIEVSPEEGKLTEIKFGDLT